jgi:hypothetical protein
MSDTNPLFFSSFIFVTNLVSAWYYGYDVYSFLFGTLTLTSILFHSYSNIYTNLIDKVAILAVVSYGIYMIYHKQFIYRKIPLAMIVTTFLLCILFFYYGYWNDCFCYHPEKEISNQYHCVLHMISSLGHHAIIFL